MAVDPRLFSGLSVFAAVLEAGNFVRAGESLGLTQSAVSRAVQRLEERLGVRLFERTSRTIRLTEDGERLRADVLPLFSHLGEVAEGMASVSGNPRGRLRVNVEPSFARLFLAPRIGAFLEAYPDVRLELFVRGRLGDLVAEGLDAAILFGEPVPSALIARRLLQVHILTCGLTSSFRFTFIIHHGVSFRRNFGYFSISWWPLCKRGARRRRRNPNGAIAQATIIRSLRTKLTPQGRFEWVLQCDIFVACYL